MDEERRRQLSEEVNEILRDRVEHINEHYVRVRNAYQTHYEWPELDPLRHEIALAITLGLYQAAIALTNHLLESLLKTALIIHHSKDAIRQQDGVLNAFTVGSAEARARFGNKDLNDTIGAARKSGLISKNQQKQLHFVRERFRNAYSHADKAKTFGDVTVPAQGVKLEDGQLKIVEEAELKMADLIIGQGIAQAISARANAADYFLYVDALVREIREKVFPPEPPDVAG